jgi:DNA-binding SARP family transcriptional activator/tetratricopeptide (TPR) repeat protein/chloramphenicol 3-O-phosphotransferase
MRFRVLGPLEVTGSDGEPVDLGSPKLRALLSLLLLDAGRVVSLDRIIDQLWGDEPPASATGTLQSYVSHLRRVLEPERGPRQPATVVLTRPPGYSVQAGADDLDLLRFGCLVREGETALHADDPAAAAAALDEALALWRGDPVPDLAEQPGVAAEIGRLVELHLHAHELRTEALYRSGRVAAAVGDLGRITVENPLRERFWELYAKALYASGRQADALDACRRFAAHLRDELGIEPSALMRDLEAAILRQELTVPAAPPPSAPTAGGDLGTSVGSGARIRRSSQDHAAEEPAEGTGGRIVGRRSERARLRAALTAAAGGDGTIVLLEGEAGIGKTCVAEAVAEQAAADGWQVAWSRCADDAGAPALWPWLQVLRSIEGPDARLVDTDADDADAQRFALFEDLRARLTVASHRAPLLVVLDDVQAADATSLHLLVLLMRHLDDASILVVGTARTVGEELPAYVEESFVSLGQQAGMQRLMLNGLGEGDVRELLAGRLGLTDDAHLAHDLHARTEGNPFFVVELAQLLRSESRPGDAVGNGSGGARVDVPRSVRDVLSRRLARLPESTVDVLGLAALIGREVDLTTLERASGIGAEELITALEPAVISGVITENTETWSWRFSHALVQETLVANTGRLAQAKWHAQIAAALEERPATASDVDRLAHHWFQAVPVAGTEPAYRYAVLAAEDARQRFGHEEAAQLTRRALDLLDAGDTAQRQTLLVALANDLLRSSDTQAAQPVVEEALELARRLGDTTRMAEAASVWGGVTLWNWRSYGVVDLDTVALLEELAAAATDQDPTLRAKLLGTLGVELAYSVRRDEGVRYAEQAVQLARSLDDVPLIGRTLNNYGLVTWGSEQGVELRLKATDEAVALSGRGLPARTEFFARLHRGPLRLHVGDVDGFEADLEAATRLGANLTGPEVAPHLLYEECGRAMLRGQWDDAATHAEQAYELFSTSSQWGAQMCWALHQYTFTLYGGRDVDALDLMVDMGDGDIALMQSGAILLALRSGDTAEAARLRRRWQIGSPTDWTSDALLALRAELALAEEQDIAQQYAAMLPFRGRQIVVGTATACWGGYDELLGRLARALDRDDDARTHFEDAVREGERMGSPLQVDRARTAIADL